MNLCNNIIKYVIIFFPVLIFSACAISDKHVQYKWNLIHDKKYDITGQVLDYTGSPVKGCRIYLVQRRFVGKERKNIDENTKILKVNHMDDTGSEGQFYFTFEPDPNTNDIWVSFLDPENIFEYKSICINNELGDTILQYPGNNPVLLNVVLNKQN